MRASLHCGHGPSRPLLGVFPGGLGRAAGPLGTPFTGVQLHHRPQDWQKARDADALLRCPLSSAQDDIQALSASTAALRIAAVYTCGEPLPELASQQRLHT